MQRRHFLSLVTAAAIAASGALASFPAAQAQTAMPEAEKFINTLAERAIMSLGDRGLTDGQRAEKFKVLLRENFDIPSIGRFVLGRYWRAATEAQRAEYLPLFETYLTRLYADRFKEYSDERLRIGQTRTGPNNEILISSTITRTKAAPIEVLWRTERVDGKFQVLDVWIEGVSMAVTQRDEFAATIQRSGGKIDALLAMLRSRAKDGVAQIAR
jgi:phospholipid transport system substrate-binding protein